MKKLMVIFVLLIVCSGLGLAAQTGGKNIQSTGSPTNVQAQNTYRLQTSTRSVLTDLETNIEEDENGNNVLRVMLSNGRNAEVKVMPSTASVRALERLRLRVCSEENNCVIELKETGESLAYRIRAEKRARFLGIFPAKGRVEAEINAETGEVISTKKPWWFSISKETDEEPEETNVEEQFETVETND